MKFKLTKSSNWQEYDECPEIEINTIEELIEFIENENEDLVIHRPRRWNENNWIIEIYNTWRE